jgi:hypothetical protein
MGTEIPVVPVRGRKFREVRKGPILKIADRGLPFPFQALREF